MVQLLNSHRQPTSDGIQIGYLEAAAHFPPRRSDENCRLLPWGPTDIDRQLDNISRDLTYLGTLLAELWQFVFWEMRSPIHHCGDSFPSIKNTWDLPRQPIIGIPTDPRPDNGGPECLWLPEGSGNPCNHRFESRRDFISHLNRAHQVNGTAKRKIICRWILKADSLLVCGSEVCRASFSRHVDTHFKTTFACPHLGCPKRYSRHDVLQKHLKMHPS
ncbi:hypothetical protein EDC04DRAFT_1221177 [Pisolithus marmoratus]|nr:hypothetical protein EDC04DRAFT_1221177 [Pisolithus marmoratus]